MNSVCTHMADLDYGRVQLFPGNYDEYMIAATQVRERYRKMARGEEARVRVLRFTFKPTGVEASDKDAASGCSADSNSV